MSRDKKLVIGIFAAIAVTSLMAIVLRNPRDTAVNYRYNEATYTCRPDLEDNDPLKCTNDDNGYKYRVSKNYMGMYKIELEKPMTVTNEMVVDIIQYLYNVDVSNSAPYAEEYKETTLNVVKTKKGAYFWKMADDRTIEVYYGNI